jgi:hypothetical protein
MDETSANLKLPYIMAAQAQKHVTHNEALRALDAIIQLSVLDRDLVSPPETASNGERYIVGTPAGDGWSGKDNLIAAYQDNAWAFYEPQEGWIAWVADEKALIVWNGTTWNDVADDSNSSELSLNPLTDGMLGINATADVNNRLAVSSPGTAFSHEGDGHNIKINKATAGNTASFIFQTNWSGRAELGCMGNDNFGLKVSSDGASWYSSIEINSSTGSAKFVQPVELPQYGRNHLPSSGLASAMLIYIWDANGGAGPAYYDGGGWKMVRDGAVP